MKEAGGRSCMERRPYDQKSHGGQSHAPDHRLCSAHPVRYAVSAVLQSGGYHDRGQPSGRPGSGRCGS